MLTRDPSSLQVICRALLATPSCAMFCVSPLRGRDARSEATEQRGGTNRTVELFLCTVTPSLTLAALGPSLPPGERVKKPLCRTYREMQHLQGGQQSEVRAVQEGV